jgi:hypothetical protein
LPAAAPPLPARRNDKARRRGKGPAPELPVAPREGIGFAPDPRDSATVFTVWASPLGERIVAEDLDDLKAGADEALHQLDACEVAAASETVLGNLIRIERIYTFREGVGEHGAGVLRKRKQWLLYVDTWLICLTWQGSSPEEYDYWFAMANQTFLTFEIPQALWFYSDRELLATSGTTADTTAGTSGVSATGDTSAR